VGLACDALKSIVETHAVNPTNSNQPQAVPEIPTPEEGRPVIAVRSFGVTDKGKIRPTNEDQFLIAELARILWVRQTSLPQQATHHGRNRGHLLLVADGMGGHQAGEVASALSVATIENFILHVLKRFSNIQASDEQAVVSELQTALKRADARIFEEASHHPEFMGMGTTLTMAFISGWKLFVMHAGDSRCYLLRGGKLRQLTTDHTVAAELARRGVIRPEAVSHHHFRHVVTSVLGGDHSGVQVEVQRVDLESGDVLLLCSDGLSDMLADEQIAAILRAELDPEQAARRLLAGANEQGGTDNITAVIARIELV